MILLTMRSELSIDDGDDGFVLKAALRLGVERGLFVPCENVGSFTLMLLIGHGHGDAFLGVDEVDNRVSSC